MINQRRAVSSLTSVSVAGVDLPVANSMKVLGITLDHCLTFNNHARVSRDVIVQLPRTSDPPHTLSTNTGPRQMLACSPILPSIDYCYAVL